MVIGIIFLQFSTLFLADLLIYICFKILLLVLSPSVVKFRKGSQIGSCLYLAIAGHNMLAAEVSTVLPPETLYLIWLGRF